MAITIAPDPAEEASLKAAAMRIRENRPEHEELRPRAARGSLHLNLTTLALESGVKRHRIELLYPELAAAVAEASSARSSSPPLRHQLDGARTEKAKAEARLGRSQAYSFRLLERITQMGVEIQLLKERIEELENGGSADEEDLVGSVAVVGIPGVPKVPADRTGGRRAA